MNRVSRLNPTTLAASTAAVRRRVRGPVTTFLGDSLTVIYSTPGASPTYASNWTMKAAHLMGGRMIRVGDNGVTNETVQQIAARVGNVIALAPDRCNVLAGTNNTNAAGLPAAMTSYENDIVRPLLAAGIEPILCTIPPRGGVRVSDPVTWKNTLKWNAFVRVMATKYHVPLVDLYAAVVDTTTGDWLAGYSDDATHPNAIVGTNAFANAWVAAMNSHYPERVVPLPQQRYDTLAINGDPLFLGALASGTGGIWPVGFNGSGTGITVSAVASSGSDGLDAGKWLKMSKTDAATNKNANCIITLAAAGASIGDRIALMYRYRVANSAGGGYATSSLTFRDSGAAALRIITPLSGVAEDRTGVVYFEALVPASTNDFRMDFGFSTAGTVDLYLGQFMFTNLTTNGLPALCAAT